METSRNIGRISCHVCDLLARADRKHCERCGSQLHIRRPDSLNRTWALIIAAMVLYLPANLLPITVTSALGQSEGDTIMQGVMYFLSTGEWPIALVIFTASICVPLFKMVSITCLLISIHRKSRKQPLGRTKVFRVVEFIGRWSMVDVFVVTIMVALVQLGSVANIEAGSGAIFFCAVVVVSMFAAESFDPRLIWDECGTDD